MTYLRLYEYRDGYESDLAFFSRFIDLNASAYLLGYDRITAWSFKNTDIVQVGALYWVEVVYKPMPNFLMRKVNEDEFLTANFKALENNTDGLEFITMDNDKETMIEFMRLLGDTAITCVCFETYTGDYTNVHVRYGTPAFRADDTQWYKIVPRLYHGGLE